MPFEIKNTKDFPLRIFFFLNMKLHVLYNTQCTIKSIMHIKMSWMKSIKCLPLILQGKEKHTKKQRHDAHTWATSRTRGEICILK